MQRQPIIGVLTPIIGGNYYATLMQSLQRSAMEVGAKLVYIVTGGKYFDVPIALDYVDGWIIINYAVEEHFIQELVNRYKKPLVTIGKDIRRLKIDSSMVITNNEHGIDQAVQHLFDHGHRKIGFLGSLTMDDMQQRFRGYLTSMNRLGLEIKQDYIFDYGDMTVFGGRQAAEKIISNKYDLTAVVCCTDMCAHGMIQKLIEEGYSVPDDITIVGFDNSPTALYSSTPITSVAQDIEQLAKVAFEEMIERLNGPMPFSLRIVDTKLHVRESCGCLDENMPNGRTTDLDQTFQAQFLRNEQNINYEFNRYISGYKVKGIRELSWLLETYFDSGCLSIQNGYNDTKEPQLTLTEFYHFRNKKNLLDSVNINYYNNLKSFPPMLAMEHKGHNDITYIIPYRLIQNNWSLLSFSTSHQKSNIPETDFMAVVDLIETLSNTFDRLSLMDEVKNINHSHNNLIERYDIINRVSEEILFEVDFEKKTVWTNRDIVIKPKNSVLLGLEEYIHPNDIGEIKKHFYEHYRDNKPFFIEIRVKNANDDNYYSAYVTGESTRDKYGNIQKLVGTIRDVMMSRRQTLSSQNELPSIISRRDFYSEIKRLMDVEHAKFALIVIDIDNFKIINDTYGIQIGDEIIDIIFNVLSSSIGANDRISRLGGDEFIVLYHFTDIKEVEEFAQHIMLTSTSKVNELQSDIKLSVSIGYSIFPDDGEEYEELMRKSDIALFHMKHNGKSNYKRFELSMVEFQQDKRRIEKLIRDALAFNRFKLFFQPQVDVKTKKVYGVEVLLRLYTENGTIVPPDHFIPLAEKLGLIIPIGEWVIRAACKQAVEWLFNGYAPLRISVNISGHQLKSVQFISVVKEILEETGMNPSLLTFEITETTIIEQTDNVMHAIEELRRLGISIAIDDFGISYSSLAVLKDFPIEILKIDKSFIKEMNKDHKGHKIVNAIINIGKSLDMRIVAEGVETLDQLNALDQLECHYCQGYYISRPVGEKEIETYLPIPHAVHRK